MSQKDLIAMLYQKHGKHLLTKREARNELGISEGTIDGLRKMGDITGKRVKGQVMFSLSEVARFIGD